MSRYEEVETEPYTTIISFEEQMRGWLAYGARSRSAEAQVRAYSKLHGMLDDFLVRPILDFDAAAAAEYQRLAKAKLRIGTMDLKIAAIALAQDALLVSRNLVDFQRVPKLRVEDWTAGD
jgi:tRNA(fMet)-specific endonuclease VapC